MKKFRNFIFKHKKGLALSLVVIIGLGTISGVTITAINSKDNTTVSSNNTSDDTLTEQETNKNVKYLESKQIIDVEQLKNDLSSYAGYEFEETVSEDKSLKVYKDKNSNLTLQTSIDDKVYMPNTLGNNITLSREEFYNYDILSLSGVSFFADNNIGINKEDLITKFKEIQTNEKSNPAKGNSENETNFYNISYQISEGGQTVGFDNFISIYIVAKKDEVTVSLELQDTNPQGIDYSEHITKIPEVAANNNFNQLITSNSYFYQKRIGKDFIVYMEDKSLNVDTFTLSSVDTLTLDSLTNKVDYMLNFLYDTLQITDEEQIKYINDNVHDILPNIVNSKENGITTLPLEVFLWKMDLTITTTTDGYKIVFSDIQNLNDL